MRDEARLKIGGKIFAGWKSFSIVKSIETLTGTFSLSVTDNWTGLKEPWPIRPGDEVGVYIGTDLLITGYVDSVENKISASERTIEVAGRDVTGDLVDCSVDNGYQFNNIKLEKLCAHLVKPFNFVVTTKVQTGAAIPIVAVTAGDSIFETAEKRVRQKGFLIVTNKLGELEIISPGSVRGSTALVQGVNILTASLTKDIKDRFSLYKVKVQNNFGDVQAFQTLGMATDAAVPRARTLVLKGETQMDSAHAKKRAQYEAIVRAARGTKVNVQVQGFRQADNSIWEVNQLVRVNAPSIGLESEELLVTDVSFSLEEGSGSVTTLGLKRKDAFIAVPEVLKKNEVGFGLPEAGAENEDGGEP